MMASEEKMQEAYSEFQMLDQNIKQLQKQLEAITQQLMDMNATSNTLEEFKKTESGKKIFVPLSSGIFAEAEIKSTSSLLVNVGSNVVVTKDVSSTKKLIERQMEEVKSLHKRMVSEYENMTSRAAELEMNLQKMISEQQGSS